MEFKPGTTKLKYGIMYSESPSMKPDTVWYESEEDRDLAAETIVREGTLHVEYADHPIGRTVYVYAFQTINSDGVYLKRSEAGE